MRKKHYTLSQMLKTVTGRITLLIATLVIPINLISLIMLGVNYVNARGRIESEIDSSLEQMASALRSEIMNTKKQLLYQTLDAQTSAVILELKDKEITDLSRRYMLIQDVTEVLQKIQLIQNQANLVYYYFEEKDLFIHYGEITFYNEGAREVAREINASFQEVSSRWEIRELNGVPVLLNVQHLNGMDYGMFLQLNKSAALLRRKMDLTGRELFLGNEDGSVLTSNGLGFLKDNGLTFSELKENRSFYLAQTEVRGTGLYLYEVVSSHDLDGMTGLLGRVLLIVLGIFTIVVVPALIYFIRRFVIHPLDDLNDAMDRIESGDMAYRIKEEPTGLEFEHINTSFNAMLDQLEDLKIEMYERDIEEKNVRLEYLSQQIQPHFILNALNILYSYDPEEYELSQKMIMCISKYFRHIVYANDKFVSLKSEMDHIANYFEIQKARYPELFYSIVEYEEELAEALIPPLVIQTFAENSIKNSLKIGNRITIFLIAEKSTYNQSDYIRIRLADTGEGISDTILTEIKAFEETGMRQEHLGVGIQNTLERFKVIYKENAVIRFSRDENYPGTNIEILLPLHFRGENFEAEEFE